MKDANREVVKVRLSDSNSRRRKDRLRGVGDEGGRNTGPSTGGTRRQKS